LHAIADNLDQLSSLVLERGGLIEQRPFPLFLCCAHLIQILVPFLGILKKTCRQARHQGRTPESIKKRNLTPVQPEACHDLGLCRASIVDLLLVIEAHRHMTRNPAQNIEAFRLQILSFVHQNKIQQRRAHTSHSLTHRIPNGTKIRPFGLAIPGNFAIDVPLVKLHAPVVKSGDRLFGDLQNVEPGADVVLQDVRKDEDAKLVRIAFHPVPELVGPMEQHHGLARARSTKDHLMLVVRQLDGPKLIRRQLFAW
jgi:hypothetical protein